MPTMAIEPSDTDWLTAGQAARRLEVSVAWVRHLADDGRLVCTRTALGRLISSASVDALKAEREATS